MTYQSQWQLAADNDFIGRTQSVSIQQANIFKDDQRQNFVALAKGVLRGDLEFLSALTRVDAAGPGIADKADNGDGTIDQSKVTDADLLSLTQSAWPVIADVYFNVDGTPIGG